MATLTCVAAVAIAVLPGKADPVGYVFAPLLFVVSWRAWRLGAYPEANAVRVVNPSKTSRVAWEDVDHFAALPAGNYPYVGHVIRNHGRPVIIFGICPAGPETERHRIEAQTQIDGLNDTLKDSRESERAHPRRSERTCVVLAG